jgi:ubiquinone/menaquinone biosynthesis C-methylase UbiE
MIRAMSGEAQPETAPSGGDPQRTGGVGELVDREREFFDTRGGGLFRILRLMIWRAIGEFNRDDELQNLYDPSGKRVLLYGCGEGNEVPFLLKHGAVHICGFDISEAEIARARESAVHRGYADRVEFITADAHHMPYADQSFDVIIGNAILHHLDLELALDELRRVLRPGGHAVFREPLADNPLLKLGRAITPAARTPDEHPLTVADWQLCARRFPRFTHHEVELLSIPLMPLNLILPRSLQRRLARFTAAADDWLFARLPWLRRYARTTLLSLSY